MQYVPAIKKPVQTQKDVRTKSLKLFRRVPRISLDAKNICLALATPLDAKKEFIQTYLPLKTRIEQAQRFKRLVYQRLTFFFRRQSKRP